MLRRRGSLLLLLVAAGAGSPALAAPAVPGGTAEEQARAHFYIGRGEYALGHYRQAIVEFSAAYRLLPQKPQFLLNIGLAYQKLGERQAARTAFARFLAEAKPDDPDRAETRRMVAELDRTAAPPPAPPESPPPAPPAPPVARPAIAAPTIAAAPVQAAGPPRRSFWRRWGWTLPVAAAVVAALVVGIYFGVQPSLDCTQASYGCLRLDGR